MFTIYRLTLSVQSEPARHYIGCTSKPVPRKSQHLSKLRKGRHPNRHMQSAYDRGASVEMRVLAKAVAMEAALEIETDFIDQLRAYGGMVFNLRPNSQSNAGLRHSTEVKEKIRSALIGRNTRSPEAIARSAAKLRGVSKPAHVVRAAQTALKRWRSSPEFVASVRKRSSLSDDQVRAIRASQDKYPVLAEQYGISVASVCLIRQRRRYARVS